MTACVPELMVATARAKGLSQRCIASDFQRFLGQICRLVVIPQTTTVQVCYIYKCWHCHDVPRQPTQCWSMGYPEVSCGTRQVLYEVAEVLLALCVTYNPGVLNDLLQWQPLSWILD